MPAFREYHPAVILIFFTAMVVLSFLNLQPVFRLIGLFCACAVGIAAAGWKVFAKSCWWVLLLILIVGCINPLFYGGGRTVLFYLGGAPNGTPITLEALVYGLSSGVMLASALIWLNVYSKLMSQAGFLALFSRVAPTAALMVARVTVFIPELVKQAGHINNAQTALGARSKNLSYATTLTSQLMEWGMEKSLITADSMRARGYGSTERSSYRRMRLMSRDLIALAIILVLSIISAVLMLLAGAQFVFYPTLSALKLWWGYLPYLIFCLLPFILEGGEWLSWTLSRSKD